MPYGKIDCFDLSSRKWTQYVNRVKQFIVLNEIKDSLHVATLITVVGEPTYDLMCDLCAPDKPETKKFTELVTIVEQHLEPRRSDIAERHVFRLRRQKAGEELSLYLQSLKHLASTCNFAEKLEENLRDQFVSGLAGDEMRSRLFAEKDLNYKRAVELALALEAAERHAETSGSAGAQGAASALAGAPEPPVHRIGGGGSSAFAAHQARGANSKCWRCGRQHPPDKCRYRRYNCDECGVRGHLKAMCNSARSSGVGAGDPSIGKSQRRNQFYIEMDSESENSDFFNIVVDGEDDKPYVVPILVNNISIDFEVDTGSKISAINERDYQKYFRSCHLSKCNLRFKGYTGGKILPIGFINTSVCYSSAGEKREAHELPLYVIPEGGPPLLGRSWLRHLKLKNIEIQMNNIGCDIPCNKTNGLVSRLQEKYPDVFAEGLGTCTKLFSLKLIDQEPIFHKARNLPLALRGPVEQELDRLVKEGTIVKVEHSEYGTPIVPVVKKCGSIRICGDYKVTINPKIRREPYPLPRIEELYATLRGAQVFSKIDLAHAYEQIILSPESRPCTTISTHVGTFEYIRTPYGVCSIPEKFQKLMEEVLRGVPMTAVYFDDACIGGVSKEDNIKNVHEVLRRLQAVGLRVKLEKCEFFKPAVCYVGHVIDKDGLHPDTKKVKAISNAPHPTDVHQLKAFLGLVNYYGKFVPMLSTVLSPLYRLLKGKVNWKWSPECEQAFNKIKKIMCSEQCLAHYDPMLPLVLSVDSSAYGLGAVLAHRYPNGSERPICCVSRTLNDAEKSYSQLDKEALAIFFGVVKNHQYLFGRRFIIRTDHKPLSYIFGENVGIPQTAASRLQRYAARLAAYDFSVEWVSSAQNAAADCLSRLPLARETSAVGSSISPTLDDTVSYLMFIENEFPISHKDIADATKVDPILRVIYKNIVFGWPDHTDVDQERAYFNRKDNLLVEQGCIVFNYRIVVPPKYRQYILRELHEGHLGVVKMKSIARNYVYWPGLDADIEALCRACGACLQQRDAPPHAPLTPWEFPSRPWQRLHADFAEYKGKHYLVVVDAHSKWIEVFQMNSTAAKFVIEKFREIFARFGLPLQMVTDNGPPFSSHELRDYFTKNNIIYTPISPYRPKGNGAAENAVRTVKNCIKKAYTEGVDVAQAISKMLFQYRNCEQATTNVAPAVALIGRRLRGRLDALRPSAAERVRARQAVQVERAGGTQRDVQLGDPVYFREYSKNNSKWVEGQVKEQVGPSSFSINVSASNNTVKRHIDQMIVPKVNRKRFSLSCTTNDNPVSIAEKANVNSNLCKELPFVTSNEPVVAVAAASSPRERADVKPGDEQGDAFEMACSSPAVVKDAHYLRPRHNRHPYYK